MIGIEEIKQAIRRAGAADLKSESVGLPMGAYASPELFALEVERVFRPGWLALGHEDLVRAPNSYHSVDLVGEPLLLTRDEDGQVHVFSRLCPHRGMAVVDGCGQAARVSCPYHRWTFNLAGQCKGAPFMAESEGFSLADHGLHRVRHELWNGFVFVNLDGLAPPLAPGLASLHDKMVDRGIDQMTLVDTIDFGEIAMDWKLLLENSVECYHHLGTHAKSLQKLFPAELTWADTGHADYAITYSVARAEGADENTTAAPLDDTAKAQEVFNSNTGRLIHVFPFTRFALRKDNMTHFQIFPLAAGRMRLLVHFLLPKALADGPQAQAMKEHHAKRLAVILGEDIEMCVRMQLMASSRVTKVGRLSQLEEPLWNFYRYLAGCLDAPTGRARAIPIAQAA